MSVIVTTRTSVSTPDDQKEKLVNITKAVANDADYQSLVIGNAGFRTLITRMLDNLEYL